MFKQEREREGEGKCYRGINKKNRVASQEQTEFHVKAFKELFCLNDNLIIRSRDSSFIHFQQSLNWVENVSTTQKSVPLWVPNLSSIARSSHGVKGEWETRINFKGLRCRQTRSLRRHQISFAPVVDDSSLFLLFSKSCIISTRSWVTTGGGEIEGKTNECLKIWIAIRELLAIISEA